ncbi:MAG: VWA domain-containing protein [Terracidiphilus sp.]|jgi:VWFA-related protein
MLRSRSALPVLALVTFLSGPVFAQTAATPETEAPVATLKLNVRTVLVDVVVTDKKGQAVPGLQKDDFQVFEDGKPQTLTFFEPNFAADSSAASATPAAALPPNTFTNVPAVAPNEAVNVLLMDSLNTPVADQSYAHRQMVRYLASIPPGIRIGVFLLSEKLRIIQGFTQDAAVMRASIDRLAANPSSSALMPTPLGTAAQNTAVNMIMAQANDTGSTQLAAMASALQQFEDQQAGFEANERESMTLDALQQIARYLAGIPGRKNLIWFAGSVPLCLQAVVSATELTQNGCPYAEKRQKTLTMLADSRVSIYPIAAGGLQPDSIYTADAPPASASVGAAGTSSSNANPNAPQTPSTTQFQALIAAQSTSLNADASQRALTQQEMDQLAEATGGKAIYESNDIKKSITDDIDNGSRYYTLAYTPGNREETGREHRILVKTVSGDYRLSYRRSYLEETPKELRAAEAAPAKDPLRPMMDRGMPDFTQLRYRMRVLPSTPPADAPRAGDSPALSAPLTRYTVNFSLATDGLALVPGPDGVRHGTIEVALVVYNQAGKPLNWETRSIGLAIRPEQMAFAQNSGIPFHFDIDAPPGDVYLRTGIYDASSSRAGTLEIPLTSITVARK